MNASRKIDIPFASDSEIEELVVQFEDCQWPYERWTHRAHLAFGAWWARRLPLEQALERVRQGIQRYNKLRGDPNGYHETITVFMMTTIARFLQTWPPQKSLVEALDHLLVLCSMNALKEYYSEQRLKSPEAKLLWLPPDLKPMV